MPISGDGAGEATVLVWEFGDVVFEDVGFENYSLLTLSNWTYGDFAPKADVGDPGGRAGEAAVLFSAMVSHMCGSVDFIAMCHMLLPAKPQSA